MLKKLEAYILADYPYKTSSVIAHFLTSNSILQTICYRAKKESKLFGSDLGSVSKLLLTVYEKKHPNLSILKESYIIKNYGFLESSLYSSLAVFYIRETLASVARDFDCRYFILMDKILEALEENEILHKGSDELLKIYINILLRALEIKTLYIIGISPSLDKCVFCREANGMFYSIKDGGLVCKNCKGISRDLLDIDKKNIDFLKIIKHTSFIDILKNEDIILYNDISKNLSKDILTESLYQYTSKKIKSLKVLEDII